MLLFNWRIWWVLLWIFVLTGLFLELTSPSFMQITACDVGQGDAILITIGHRHILIDSGPNQAVLRCLQAEIPWWQSTIDLAVMTHPDQDHSGGWESVLQKYRIHTFVSNGVAADWHTLIPPAAQSRVDHWVRAEPGSAWIFPGATLRIVWAQPWLPLWNNRLSDNNDTNPGSVGLFLQASSFGFLTLGDLECPQELAVSTFGLLTKVAVLKISHHGAKTATCSDFLDKIRPEIALISVGKNNSYGHPDQKTIANLEKYGALVWRTDRMGQITMTISGKGEVIYRARSTKTSYK